MKNELRHGQNRIKNENDSFYSRYSTDKNRKGIKHYPLFR